MNCNECLELVDALNDGELSPMETGLMTEHLGGCVQCRQAHEELRALSNKITKIPRFTPPAQLADNIMAALNAESADATTVTLAAIKPAAILKTARPYLVGAALSALALYFLVITPLTRQYETGEIVSAHVRSLMGRELVAVASTDQHILRPWFAGRLDFAPKIISLDKTGFSLNGARTDYLFNGRVAAVVYGRRAHKINLFIVPVKGGSRSARHSYVAGGFNVEDFVLGEYRYIAISDLNGKELRQFTNLISRSTNAKAD